MKKTRTREASRSGSGFFHSAHSLILSTASALVLLILAACSGSTASSSATAPPSAGIRPSEENLAAAAQSASPLPPQPTALSTTAVNSTDASIPATGATSPAATAFPDPAGYQWTPIAAGLESPVGIANAGDGSGRLFVIEKVGRIRLIQNDALQAQPFLDITNRVGSRGSEQGLLGLVFHPRFKENGYFYVNYTDTAGNTVISRFRVALNSNQADPNSESVLLQVEQPYSNHNGGGLAFGPDGDLYIGLGDGGSEGDPLGNGQSTQTLLGKLLRLDVDKGQPYTIPSGNAFPNGQGGRPEIWAYGLRNPWRFSFDSATGDLYIADVGQDTWEEIDFLPAGSPAGMNFGWSYREGKHPYQGAPPADLKLVDPIWEYNHAEGGCSITGGYVYRGQKLPAFQGVYLYGDYCSGKIWGLIHLGGAWQAQELFETSFAITSFGVDETHELYVADQHGQVYRLEAR